MPKRAAVDDLLAELHAAIAGDAYTEAARAALLGALESKHALLVAAAADAIASHELDGFEVALTAAHDRFLENPVKRDPFCRAKTAAVRALYRTGARGSALFLRGIGYVQREPVWGGTQ